MEPHSIELDVFEKLLNLLRRARNRFPAADKEIQQTLSALVRMTNEKCFAASSTPAPIGCCQLGDATCTCTTQTDCLNAGGTWNALEQCNTDTGRCEVRAAARP